MIVHLECLYSSLVLLTIVQNNKKFNSAALARDSVSVCEERNIEDLIINNTFYITRLKTAIATRILADYFYGDL